MSRPLRLEFPGAIWHVTSRGNERHDIIRDDHDRRHFVDVMSRVAVERRWLLHAWVLMSNHYHLLVETPEVGLSRGVKSLNQEYASSFNQRHDRVGHLFQGRFKGILVERDTHLLELVRYIVLNPVRAGIVTFAEDYEWSNYRATAGVRPAPVWLDVEWTLRQFANNRDEYRRFVAAGRGASYAPWDSLLGQMYLGSETFREEMQVLVESRERSRAHPRPQRVWTRPDAANLSALVSAEFAVPETALARRSGGPARKALAQIAADDAALPFRAVGTLLGTTDSAASKMRTAGRALYDVDRDYRERVDRIRARLT